MSRNPGPEANNPGASQRYGGLIVLILLPLLVLYPCLSGAVIGPFDQIRQMAPWNGPKPAQPWDVLQSDGVLQFYQWRDLVFDAWGHGRIPFWNTFELAGTPLLANSQSAALYPPHVLAGLLHLPTGFAMFLLAWFHLALAGSGTYFLTRRFGGTTVGATVSGVSFGLSAFAVAWTGLPSVVSTIAWVPWILGFTAALYSRGRLSDGVFLALCVGMMVLAGHLQFVAYGMMALILMSVWLAAGRLREGPRPESVSVHVATFRVVMGVVLGLLLTAPQILPVLNYSQFSHRRNTPTEEGYAAYSAGALQPFELVGIVQPSILGRPTDWAVVGDQKVPGYMPEYVQRGANFAETAVGIGPIVFAFLFAVGWRRLNWKREGALVVLAALSFLLATGTALGRVLYFFVPGWSASGSPGRICALFVISVCVLAGLGVSRLQSGSPEFETPELPPEPRSWRAFVPAIVVAASVLATRVMAELIVPLLGSWMPGVSSESLQAIAQSGTLEGKSMALAGGLAAALLLAYWLREGRRPTWVLVAASVIAAVSGSTGVLRFSGSSDLRVATAPTGERIAVVNSGWDLLSAAPALLPPNISISSRIHELGGYDSLIHRDTESLLRNIDRDDPAPAANGNILFVKPKADPYQLIDAGVTQVWSTRRLPWDAMMTSSKPHPWFEFAGESNGFFRYLARGPGIGRAVVDGSPAQIVSEGFDTLKVTATGPGHLTVRERNIPGWLAKLDGKPVTLADGTWITVPIETGPHSLELNYVAPGFMTGVFMAFVALLAVAFQAWMILRSRRLSVHNAEEFR